jgi:hypothetical protein
MSNMVCEKCGWKGDFQNTIVAETGRKCPSCKGTVIPDGITRPTPEFLEDIGGAEHLLDRLGERFRSYYLFKKFKRTESMPLDYKDLTYRFNICDFEVKFVLPAKLDIPKGSIFYSEAERLFGMFRFPRDNAGNFSAPIKIPSKITDQLKTLKDKDVAQMLNRPRPLVFEAYKIPVHFFEYFDLTPPNLVEIETLTDKEFITNMKARYDQIFGKALECIRGKIESEPNYLLILEKTLCRDLLDLDDVAKKTNNIIHI